MNTQTVAVIDYGMGNLRSVAKALEHVAPNQKVIVTREARLILDADRVVFPGVGALRDCIHELERAGLRDVVITCSRSRPLLGICLGMQALFDFSEENDGTQGLQIIPGKVVRFREQSGNAASGRQKIPHMGWSPVDHRIEHPLWHDIADTSRFYFVHSYYVEPADRDCIAGTTDYGARFASAISRKNIFAVQFHPEKSQRDGLRLLGNFTVWNGDL